MLKNFATFAFVVMVAGAAAQQPKLRVGSPAPAVTVAKWVKGGPVGKMGAGKVHVVEFWATWCGPCRESIPHLTELAKKYKGKATFSGISVYENQKSPQDTSYMAGVAKFVKEMGTRMNYNVGVDGPNKVMANRWMEAAAQEGIPTAFVVGRDGKIAWIGHPMDGLDEVVGKVVAGTYDVKAEAARKAKLEAEQRERMKVMQPLIKAYGEKDWPTVAKETERLTKAQPKMAASLAMVRFEALYHTDEPAAYAYARELANTIYKGEPGPLNQIAWTIVDDATGLKTPDFETAALLAQQAVTLTKEKDPNILDTLGYALWKKGDKTKALEVQAKAAKLANADPSINSAAKKEILERYEMMKKG